MQTRAAVGYVSANEPSGDTGTAMCKGMERLAREDEERALWLDLQLVEGMAATRRSQALVRMANHRKRLVPA